MEAINGPKAIVEVTPANKNKTCMMLFEHRSL